jgi:hypothetical protein
MNNPKLETAQSLPNLYFIKSIHDVKQGHKEYQNQKAWKKTDFEQNRENIDPEILQNCDHIPTLTSNLSKYPSVEIKRNKIKSRLSFNLNIKT